MNLHECEKEYVEKKKKTSKNDFNIQISENDMIQIFNETFSYTHSIIIGNEIEDGTAALVALFEHDSRRIIIANSGDQRAVICRGDLAIQLTNDHKPDDPNEILRIHHCGGYVTENKRVDGILALSRALGDADLQPHVTYEPEVMAVDLVPEDRFLIIACDGIWDVLSNEQAVEIVKSKDTPTASAIALRDAAYGLGSSDNITVIVYSIENFANSIPTTIRGRYNSNKHVELRKSKSTSKSREKRIKTLEYSLPDLDRSSHI